MKRTLCILGAMALLGCENVDLNIERKHRSEDDLIYATAVVFPENYDWAAGRGGDTAAQLVVFRDTACILKLETSPYDGVSTEADMHHLVQRLNSGDDFPEDGVEPTLFCDWSTSGGETVITQGNSELFRFKGRECVEDIIDLDGDIYTLGSRRDGSGWAFRCNGKTVLDCNDGYLLGSLHLDDGRLCFGYAKGLETTGSNRLYHYYFVRDSTASRIACEKDFSSIVSVRSLHGVLNYLAESSTLPGILWMAGDDGMVIDSRGKKVRGCMLEKIGGELVCRVQQDMGVTDDGKAVWTEYYWKRDKSYVWSGSSDLAYAFCHDAPKLAYLSSIGARKSNLMLRDGEEIRNIPERYQTASPYAICCCSDMVCVGLVDVKNGKSPVIIKGRDTLRYDFNGYFTRLCLP